MKYRINPISYFVSIVTSLRKSDAMAGVDNRTVHDEQSAQNQVNELLEQARKYVDSIESTQQP